MDVCLITVGAGACSSENGGNISADFVVLVAVAEAQRNQAALVVAVVLITVL